MTHRPGRDITARGGCKRSNRPRTAALRGPVNCSSGGLASRPALLDRWSLVRGLAAAAILFVVMWAASHYYPVRSPARPQLVAHIITPDCWTGEDLARAYGWTGDWREYAWEVERLNPGLDWRTLHHGDVIMVPDYRILDGSPSRSRAADGSTRERPRAHVGYSDQPRPHLRHADSGSGPHPPASSAAPTTRKEGSTDGLVDQADNVSENCTRYLGMGAANTPAVPTMHLSGRRPERATQRIQELRLASLGGPDPESETDRMVAAMHSSQNAHAQTREGGGWERPLIPSPAQGSRKAAALALRSRANRLSVDPGLHSSFSPHHQQLDRNTGESHRFRLCESPRSSTTPGRPEIVVLSAPSLLDRAGRPDLLSTGAAA